MNHEIETVTIFVEISVNNKTIFLPVQAQRTTENYFHILSEPAKPEESKFKIGDVVRCEWQYFDDSNNGGIVASTLAKSKLPTRFVGDRVWVSRNAGWKFNFLGTVSSGPEMSETRLGPNVLYWVVFDEPQEDMTGDGYKYFKAQILGSYLTSAD